MCNLGIGHLSQRVLNTVFFTKIKENIQNLEVSVSVI